MLVSETLRSAVKRDGRSMRQLAADAGVDRSCLVRFVNEDRMLTLPAVDRLCDLLGLQLRPARGRKGS